MAAEIEKGLNEDGDPFVTLLHWLSDGEPPFEIDSIAKAMRYQGIKEPFHVFFDDDAKVKLRKFLTHIEIAGYGNE